MTKKILAVLLALAMVLSLVSVNVFAAANETAETEEIYTYTWKDYDSNWHNISKKWHAEEFEKLLAALETEGSVVTATYTGSVGWGIQIGFKNGDENITEATTTAVHDATAKTCTVSGADLLAIVEKNAPDLSAVADCEFYINTGSEKDVHDMTISVTAPKAAEEGGEGEELQVLFEETYAGYKGEWTTILLQEKADDFIKACSAEDATVMIVIDDVDYTFTWAQFILQNAEHSSGLTVDGGSYEGDVFTIPGAAVVDAWNKNDISNSSWYQICFNSNPLADQDLEPADMYICVLAPVSSGGEGDEDGTTVKLEKATWDGGKQGNFQINIPLDDVNAVKDPSTIESFVVELTVTGAVADGKKIDVTKIGSDVAIMDPWTAAGLYISPEADGTLKLEVPAAKIGTSNNWIIQLYIDGENLPSGLDTKEASLTYKDFKITINYKPEPKKCDHEDDYDATEVKGTIEEGVFTPTAPIEDAEYVHVVFDGDVDEGATIIVNYVPEEVNPHIPEGYEVINEINGKELTAAVPSWGGDPDATFARLANESYDLEADDYIYAAVVPADGVDYSAWQIGLNDATNWNGNVGSETGELEVGAYVKDIFGKLADGTPVTVENFTSIWCQIWHAKEGESIKSSTVLIARKDSTPAVNSVKVDAVAPCTLVAVDPTRTIASITVEGATIAKIEVLTKKATKPTNPAIPGLPNVPGLGFGYPIQLGNEYHGFLLADGSMITMPHEFNANGFCTVCGYTVLNNSTPATDVTVDVPTEAPETQEDDTEGDDMNVSDEVETPKEDENPKTGLALAVLPMLAAAAVAAASRKH